MTFIRIYINSDLTPVTYELDTDERVELARQALRDAGLKYEDVWAGDPGCPDSHKTSSKLFAASSPNRGYADYLVTMASGERWTLRMRAEEQSAPVYVVMDDEGEPVQLHAGIVTGDARHSPLEAAQILCARWDSAGSGYGSEIASVL